MRNEPYSSLYINNTKNIRYLTCQKNKSKKEIFYSFKPKKKKQGKVALIIFEKRCPILYI